MNKNRYLDWFKQAQAANELDLYYISARYPDGLPEGAPYEIIDQYQAGKAIRAVEHIFNFVTTKLSGVDSEIKK